MVLLNTAGLKRDPAISIELAANLAVKCVLDGFFHQQSVNPLLGEAVEQRFLGVEGVSQDQHLFKIHLPEQLPQHRPLMILGRGVASLG